MLIEKKLVQGTWGNISVRIDDENMLVTPSGLDYDSLGPEDMVRVNLKTLDFDKTGNKPTTEMNLHAEIYNNRPDVGAIIHTHSKNCSIFAACRMPIDVTDTSLSEEVAGDVIHIAEYASSGSDELAANVVKALGGAFVSTEKDDSDLHAEFEAMLYGRRGCLMANHGMVAVGADLDGTMKVAEAMEEAARQQINALLLKRADNN